MYPRLGGFYTDFVEGLQTSCDSLMGDTWTRKQDTWTRVDVNNKTDVVHVSLFD